MKNIILTALAICWWWTAEAQNSSTMKTNQQDSLIISQLLEDYYFKGIYNGDLTALHRIFNPGTLLFGDVKGQPYAKTLDAYLEAVKNRQSPKDSGKPFKGEILDIRVVNSIAVAEVKLKMYDFHYHDILAFHKIRGEWYIVNKMMSDVSE